MKTKLLFTILLAVYFTNVKCQILTKVDSVQFQNAQIWGVLSDDGDSLCATTIFTPSSKPQIFMRKINYTNISGQSALKQLTFDADFTSIPNLTDHKSIIFNNEIYVVFSTQGDQDLFLFKTDINGNRIGNIVPVVTASTTGPTNDMILTTDGTYIFVLYFSTSPYPNQHHVYKYDTNLNPVGSPTVTTTLQHNNIGNAMFVNNEFWMFTGNLFGFNSNLILTKWNSSWAPTIGIQQTVVSASGGDGNWFSTGEVYDTTNLRWYIGMNHINSGQTIGQEHIDLLAFDDQMNLLERKHISPTSSFRTHFVLKNNFLYVTYDHGAGVYLLKYSVQNTTGIEQSENKLKVFAFPNPFNFSTTIQLDAVINSGELNLYNVTGQKVKTIKNISGHTVTLFRDNLPSGLYFIRLTQDNKVIATKKIVIAH